MCRCHCTKSKSIEGVTPVISYTYIDNRYCTLQCSLIQFVAVVLAVGGIVLFAYVNGFGATTVEGVLMSVGSAMGAALYKVYLIVS